MKQKNYQQSKVKVKIPLVETQLSKVSGVNRVNNAKEPLKKDLIIQLDQLQEKYINLENKFKDLGEVNKALNDQNNKNLETITCMQKKIESFEKEKGKTSVTKQTQTEKGIDLKCTECNFEAFTNTELSWHLGEIHGWSDDQKNEEVDMDYGPRLL